MKLDNPLGQPRLPESDDPLPIAQASTQRGLSALVEGNDATIGIGIPSLEGYAGRDQPAMRPAQTTWSDGSGRQYRRGKGKEL